MDETSRATILHSIFKLFVITVSTYITIRLMKNQLDPTNKEKKAAAKKFSEYELMIASHLVDPCSMVVSWENIGGLGDVIQEIKDTIILPIKRKDLFAQSKLTQPPKGVLLHGPPGCGKTMIAKATAREAGCNFINLDPSMLTDKWYGESQKLAAAVFSLAAKLQPCIIFLDEIDSFLRNRNVQDHEATAMMKAQFMTLWDGLNTDPNITVIVMGATNRPQDLDGAFRRRMPATYYISSPTQSQREAILNLIMKNEPIADNVNLHQIALNTEGFSGSDLRELCRSAAIRRIRDFIKTSHSMKKVPVLNKSSPNMSLHEDEEKFTDTVRPITMEDLVMSLNQIKESNVSTSTFTE